MEITGTDCAVICKLYTQTYTICNNGAIVVLRTLQSELRQREKIGGLTATYILYQEDDGVVFYLWSPQLRLDRPHVPRILGRRDGKGE